MVWGAVTYYGTVELSFQSTRMNAKNYIDIIQGAFSEIQDIFEDQPFVFQQDNAPIHTARIVKVFFDEQNVELLKWPTYSLDLNIVENTWGYLSRKVYEGGTQYEDVNELTID